MLSNILLCKIGSYLPFNKITDFLVLKRGLDCNLFWYFITKRLFVTFPQVKSYKVLIRSYMT